MTAHAVERVHLIYKTHLDLGFTDLAAHVLRRYIEDFIPGALRLARHQRESGSPHLFTWTTGSWLIERFLSDAAPAARRELEAAIEVGDIAWHGLPFTTHTEFMDADLFRYGLSIAKRLDARFGRQTIAGKMTDVPGHTRGMIPLLAEAGIEFLHFGVNQTSAVPDVPPMFVWRDEATETSVIVMYSGEYGEITPIPGTNCALALVLTGDNLGPPTPQSLAEQYRMLEREYPHAQIIPSTLDAFARELRAIRETLPIITDEIGDTWIHGVGSDPTKVRRFRELRRLRRAWPLAEPAAQAFDDALLCVAEHTWGKDVKLHIADHPAYNAAAFDVARHTPPFVAMEESWAEQNAYIDSALRALDGTPFRAEADAALAALEPREPDLAGFELCDPAQPFNAGALTLGFDPQDGAINLLRSRADGRMWADADHRLAALSFQSFDVDDYARFQRQYMRNLDNPDVAWWALRDFTKYALGDQGRSQTIRPSLVGLYRRSTDAAHDWIVFLTLPDDAQPFGAPARMMTQVSVSHDQPRVSLRMSWFNKTAARLPHAIWCGFTPIQVNGASWSFRKLGTMISPEHVVRRGARTLHSVDGQIDCVDERGTFRLETLDAPLIAPAQPSLVNYVDSPPNMAGGVHVNLYNNVWNTNFPLWFSGNGLARFELSFEAR